jgi:hypothetical protein
MGGAHHHLINLIIYGLFVQVCLGCKAHWGGSLCVCLSGPLGGLGGGQ